MAALGKNQTWELMQLPKGKHRVDCKWIYTVKYKSDGSLDKNKAKLVAKGYTQVYGVDYLNTFTLVAKLNTVRVLLSLAANLGWPLQQYDVKSAFMHRDLEDEVYMEVPLGYGPTTQEKVACKLKNALYGLKQSPRAWFGQFTSAMLNMGDRQSQGDHTLFIYHSATGGVTTLIVYVDDIVVTNNDEEGIKKLKKCLISEFEIKDLGRLKYFSGIKVAHSKEVDKGSYQRLVEKLIYLAHTQPNITCTVGVVDQFMHNSKEAHLGAMYKILHYLKGTPRKGIMFKNGKVTSLEPYTDADYARSIVDRRSTSGYCTLLGGNLVTWRSKKRSVVAWSSAKTKFRSMALGMCELLWLIILINDLKIKWTTLMRLYCDNKSTISIAHNPV